MVDDSFVLRLIDRIYAAAIEPELWHGALTDLSEALGGAAVQLSLRIRNDSAHGFYPMGAVEPGPIFRAHLDERYHEVMMRLSREQFPWAGLTLDAVQAGFARGADLQGFEATPFFLEFMRPQGLAPEPPLCHMIATTGAGPLSGLVIFRRKGGRAFDDADLALLERLVPHLGRAYSIHCRLVGGQHQETALREVLDRLPAGVMLLDQKSRVVLCNRSGEQILALADGIQLDAGRPRLADSLQNRAFQQMLSEASVMRAERGRSYGKTFSIVRPSGRRSFASMIGPLLAPPPGTSLREAVAILFLTDPESSQISTSEVLEGLYDLTPAEAELLRLLAEGRSLEEVAAQRGVTMNTARGQLKQVFAKTDTRRQGELVRLVLTGVASLGEGEEGGR